ncbi:MAG: FtsW/RodA/SpoVE family cell cycle protein [Parasporobacterium sp.]|nr:FtsW/RodA/SpoVE family cell cycle protein [Parasporobacterium sp.]
MLDWTLLLIVAVLVIMGLIMQYSASSYDLELVKKQGIFALAGFAVLFVVSRLPARFFYKLSVAAFALSMAAVAATMVLGRNIKGAKRWIEIGPLNFQPSELLKAALVMILAAVLCKYFHEINNLERITVKEFFRRRKEIRLGSFLRERKGYILPILIVIAAAAFVAVLTKDLGTAVIIFGIGFCMLLVISPGIRYLITILIAAGAASIGLILLFPYRMGRISAWLDLEGNTSDLGYQIQQGLYAIGSGGWFGRGLGKSIQKDFIPEPQTDMIFTIVCEELGIIGGIILIVLFVLLILRLRKIYNETADLFGKMIITGVTAHIGLQAIINMAVMANLIPNTGVPLPFISYGGTSLLILLTEIGMVMAVRKKGVDRSRDNVYDTSYAVNGRQEGRKEAY